MPLEEQSEPVKIGSTSEEILSFVNLNDIGLAQAIGLLSDQLLNGLASVKAAHRKVESTTEYLLIALVGQLYSLRMQQKDCDPSTGNHEGLENQIKEVTSKLKELRAFVKDTVEISSQTRTLVDQIEEAGAAPVKAQELAMAQIMRSMNEVYHRFLSLSCQLSALEKFIEGTVHKDSDNTEPNAFPAIFTIVPHDIAGLGKLNTLLHRATFVHCCCEFQCATNLQSKDVPVPLWHPVRTSDDSFFRRTIWQYSDVVAKLAPVLKLSYLALRLTKRMYDLETSDLSALYPEELSRLEDVDVTLLVSAFVSIASKYVPDISAVLNGDDIGEDLVAELEDKRISPILMRPSTFDPSTLHVLQSLFPPSVWDLKFFSFFLHFSCRPMDMWAHFASIHSPSPVHMAPLEPSCGYASSTGVKSASGIKYRGPRQRTSRRPSHARGPRRPSSCSGPVSKGLVLVVDRAHLWSFIACWCYSFFPHFDCS
jgi:hypothetical protein